MNNKLNNNAEAIPRSQTANSLDDFPFCAGELEYYVTVSWVKFGKVFGHRFCESNDDGTCRFFLEALLININHYRDDL